MNVDPVTLVWCVLLCAGFGAFGFWTGREYQRGDRKRALAQAIKKMFAGVVPLWQHVPDTKPREKHVYADWGPDPAPIDFDNPLQPLPTVTPNEVRKELNQHQRDTKAAEDLFSVTHPKPPEGVFTGGPKIQATMNATPRRDANGQFTMKPDTLVLQSLEQLPSYIRVGEDYYQLFRHQLTNLNGRCFLSAEPLDYFYPGKMVGPLDKLDDYVLGRGPRLDQWVISDVICGRKGCIAHRAWCATINNKVYSACDEHKSELELLRLQAQGPAKPAEPKEVVGFYPHTKGTTHHCGERGCTNRKLSHTVELKDGRVFKVCDKHINQLHIAMKDHGEYYYTQGTENG